MNSTLTSTLSTPWTLQLSKVNLDSLGFFSEAQWLPWLEKECGIATTRSEKCLVAKLFEKAHSQCNAFSIWKLFFDFVLEDLEIYLHLRQEAPEHAAPPVYDIPDQCLEILERGLDIHGGHFTSSQLLWNPYFKLCRTLGMSLEELRKKFLDRLRIPHRVLSDTFSAYSAFEAQADQANYEANFAEGNTIYQATLAEVQWMEEFEKLLEESDKVQHFLHYLSRLPSPPNHVSGMYERALSETNQDPTIWTSYLNWTLLEGKRKDLAFHLALRAHQTNPQSADLACYALRFEKNAEKSSHSLVLPSALYVMPSCADFSQVFLEFLRLNQSIPDQAHFTSILKTGFTVRSQLFPVATEEPSDLNLLSWCLEYLVHRNEKKEEVEEEEEASEFLQEIWDVFSASASSFKQWLPLLNAELENSALQPHFSVAVERVKDHPDLVLELWLEYAYRYKDISEVEYVRHLIAQHSAYVQYCQTLSAAPSETSKTVASTRKRDHTKVDNAMDVDQERADHTFVVKHVSGRQMDYLKEQYAQYGRIKKVRFLKSKVRGEQGQLFVQMGSKQSILNIFKHCQRDLKNEPRVFEMVKGATWDPHYMIRKELQEIQEKKLIQQQQYLEHQDTTLFVANLAPSVTKEDLAQFFGNLEEVRLMQTKTGASKGYAYLQFPSVQAKEEGLKLHEAVLKDRVLYVAPSNPNLRKNKNTDQVKGSRVRDFDPCLVYLRNLPFQTTQTDLLSLSHASEVRFVLDAKKRSRGIAFCQYASEEQAQDAIEKLNGLVLEGRILEASIAQPTRRGVKREDFDSSQKEVPPEKKSPPKSSWQKPEPSAPIPRALIHHGPKKKVKLMTVIKSQEEKDQGEMNVDEVTSVKDNAYFRYLMLSSTQQESK